MKRLLFILFSFPIIVFSQNQIAIDVHDVPSSKGMISVAVYNTKESFLKFDKVYKYDSILAKEGTTRIFISDLPEGEYALAIFHDENSNYKLDINWLGIPKEKVTFSKSNMKAFGPPPFKDCVFKINKDTKIEVNL